MAENGQMPTFGGGEVMVGKRSADSDNRQSYHRDPGRARHMARVDPFGTNAVRVSRDSVIGKEIRLNLSPSVSFLGVDEKAAMEWAEETQEEFSVYANSVTFDADAQRCQTFSGLMQTAHDEFFVSGECLASVESKEGFGGYKTCLNLIDPDRLSNPDFKRKRNIRLGVEQDKYGAPIAYHIRTRHPHDYMDTGLIDFSNEWKRHRRYTSWGRQNIMHVYQHQRSGQTRGISNFAAVMCSMPMLRDYSQNELESAVVSSAFAAVIESELDYEKAMMLIGADRSAKINSEWGDNPVLGMAMQNMQQSAEYHRAANIRFAGGKIPHLLPNEKLNMVKPDRVGSSFAEFEAAILRQLSAGLGIDYQSMSKNYSDVSYSAARQSMAEIWRHYLVRRDMMARQLMMPFFSAWLEEAIMIGRVPMLGKKKLFDPGVRQALCAGTFISWGKPIIDPEKERKGQQLALTMGVETHQDICAEQGDVWRVQFNQQKRAVDYKNKIGLEAQDLDPSLAFSGSGEDNAPSQNRKKKANADKSA